MGSVEVASIYGIIALAVLAVVALVLCGQLIFALRRLDRLGRRVSDFARAIELLTETSELGFRSTARELARVVEAQKRQRRPRDAQQRVAQARSRGSSVSQIAADISLADGEVGLRLLLAHSEEQRRPRAMTGQRYTEQLRELGDADGPPASDGTTGAGLDDAQRPTTDEEAGCPVEST